MTNEKRVMHAKNDVINESERKTNKLDIGTEWGKHKDLQYHSKNTALTVLCVSKDT